MAGRRKLGVDVYQAAIDRLAPLYEEGHRLVVAYSGGKDSTCTLHVAIEAAERTGRLPVEVCMLDDEVMLPGTFELAEEVATWPEVDFHWVIMGEAQLNIFNREQPYWWAFDDRLDPSQWVRQPPSWAEWRKGENNLYSLVNDRTYPPAEGKKLISVVGVRVQESSRRLLGLFSKGGPMAGGPHPKGGAYNHWPIYDWTDGDVWKSFRDFGWPYNTAYDSLLRLGIPKRQLRITPPTMLEPGVPLLQAAAKAWPRWFDKVCRRCPGVRLAAHYGRRAVQPQRRDGETWRECFQRTCVDEAPQWIAERAVKWANHVQRHHAKHSVHALPEVQTCRSCLDGGGSWKHMAHVLYCGDPFSLATKLPWVQPSLFRPGEPDWEGSPSALKV